jgi:O-antigen ligase
MDQAPIFGHGFESFWLGDRIKYLQSLWYWKPTQAHNGYIELYLNLGWVGLFFLTGVIMSCYLRLRKMLLFSSEMTESVIFARFGMAFLAGFLVYNYSEAAFKSLHFLFVIFLLVTIKSPKPQKQIAASSSLVLSEGAQQLLRPTSAASISSTR